MPKQESNKRTQKATRKDQRLQNFTKIRGADVKATALYNAESSDADSPSSESDHRSEDRKEKKHRSGAGAKDEDAGSEDEENKSIDVKEFQKVVLRRKDIVKFEEEQSFRERSKGLYVKVWSPNDDKYIVAEIDKFIQDDKSPSYKLDQKQVNVWI